MRRLGDLEAMIMAVIWAVDEPLTVRAVHEQIRRDRDVAYSTVQTVMENLFRKDWLDRSMERRTYHYWAPASREDYIAGLMHDALDESVDRTATLTRFVSGMSSAERTALRDVLGKVRRRRQRR